MQRQHRIRPVLFPILSLAGGGSRTESTPTCLTKDTSNSSSRETHTTGTLSKLVALRRAHHCNDLDRSLASPKTRSTHKLLPLHRHHLRTQACQGSCVPAATAQHTTTTPSRIPFGPHQKRTRRHHLPHEASLERGRTSHEKQRPPNVDLDTKNAAPTRALPPSTARLATQLPPVFPLLLCGPGIARHSNSVHPRERNKQRAFSASPPASPSSTRPDRLFLRAHSIVISSFRRPHRRIVHTMHSSRSRPRAGVPV